MLKDQEPGAPVKDWKRSAILETAMLKLHKCYQFMIFLIKIFAVAKWPAARVKVLKPLNEGQFQIF